MIETISEVMQLVALIFLHQKVPEPSHRAGKADEILQRGDRCGYGGGDFAFAGIKKRASQFESGLDELKQVRAVDLRCEVFKPGRGRLLLIENIGADVDDEMRWRRILRGYYHSPHGFVLLQSFPPDGLQGEN